MRTILIGLVAIAVASPALAQSQQPLGEALVQRNCAQCHAVGRKDASAMPAAPPLRDLSRSYPVEDLAEALAEGILTGHPAMPEFRFEPDEVREIIRYLESIQSRRRAHMDRFLP